MSLNEFMTCSAVAPPPTSRKLAGDPPCSLIMSILQTDKDTSKRNVPNFNFFRLDTFYVFKSNTNRIRHPTIEKKSSIRPRKIDQMKQAVNWSTDQSINQSNNQSINQLIEETVGRNIQQSINILTSTWRDRRRWPSNRCYHPVEYS